MEKSEGNRETERNERSNGSRCAYQSKGWKGRVVVVAILKGNLAKRPRETERETERKNEI